MLRDASVGAGGGAQFVDRHVLFGGVGYQDRARTEEQGLSPGGQEWDIGRERAAGRLLHYGQHYPYGMYP